MLLHLLLQLRRKIRAKDEATKELIRSEMELKRGGLKIGHVAKESGTGIETIRFYERSGLISDPPRRDSGYREYPRETIARLRFIKRAKELGFSLKEISDLMALSSSGKGTCGTMRKRTDE